MTLTIFTAPTLIVPNSFTQVGITDPDVVAGVQNPANTNAGRMPIWGGPCDGTKRGIFLTASPGANLTFRLTKRSSGWLGQSRQSEAVLFSGDQFSINISASQIMSVSAADAVTCTLTSCKFGTLTLAIVQ